VTASLICIQASPVSGPGFALQSRTRLKATVNRLKPIQCVKQLYSCLAHLLGLRAELLRVLDRESDSIHRYSRLVGHLEFNRSRARLDIGFDLFKDLMHCLRTHGNSPNCYFIAAAGNAVRRFN
jgi:hypothetical protein